MHITAIFLALCSHGQAVSYAPDPPNVAAITPNSGWECSQPVCKDGRCPSVSAYDPITDEEARNYSVELNCMVDWLSKYSEKGSLAGKVDSKLYSNQRLRARWLKRRLSGWIDQAHTRGEKPASGNVYKTSGEFYLEGVVSFQKGEFHQARTEWERSLEMDPKNSDAQSGLDRLNKMKAKNK